MRYATPMFTRSLAFAAVLAVAVTAGCASKVTAPVRDGSGAASSAPRAPAAPPGTHIVRQGDTLLGIARQYGVTLPDLVVWNGITSPNQIRPGQSLRVAPPPADTTAAAVVTPIGGAAVSTPVQQPGAADTAAVTPRQDAPLTPPPPQAAPPAPPAESAAARARRWQWPARGPVIASFNDNTNKGVDIGGRVGDPVIAAAAGKVVYAGSGLRGYGKLIVIKHDQEYNSVYAHNDKLLVKEDDQVAQGQQIAELGSTESDKPKLHFEIRKQGKAVDPAGYLPAR